MDNDKALEELDVLIDTFKCMQNIFDLYVDLMSTRLKKDTKLLSHLEYDLMEMSRDIVGQTMVMNKFAKSLNERLGYQEK